MNRLSSCWLIAGVLLGSVSPALADDDDPIEVKAAPGRETVRPMKPDWCPSGIPPDRDCDVHCIERTEVRPTKLPDVDKNQINVLSMLMYEQKAGDLSTLHEADNASEDKPGNGSVIEQGKIASLKKGKNGIVATFKTEKWDVPDYSCTYSHRIIGFEHDGTPIRENGVCKEIGHHTTTFTLEPRLFSEPTAVGLKVGQIIKVVSGRSKDGVSQAFVVEVDEPAKGKKSPQPISYFGISLR